MYYKVVRTKLGVNVFKNPKKKQFNWKGWIKNIKPIKLCWLYSCIYISNLLWRLYLNFRHFFTMDSSKCWFYKRMVFILFFICAFWGHNLKTWPYLMHNANWQKNGVNKLLRIGINWKSKEKLAIYKNNNVAKTITEK